MLEGQANQEIEYLNGALQVAKDPSGSDINALEQHIKNLLSPATPYFWNTLYDPYRPGADFVRGYPFSLREGRILQFVL